jgi:hypothetical protein
VESLPAGLPGQNCRGKYLKKCEVDVIFCSFLLFPVGEDLQERNAA